MTRFSLLFSLILIGESVANDYSNPHTVTSSPLHVSEQHSSRHYNQHNPSILTQSYRVLPESRNYYQYPQYLPTHTGYSNIQTIGHPYQIYGNSPGSNPSSSSNIVSGGSSGSSESYGYSAPSPIPTAPPSPLTTSERQRSFSPTPTPPSPFSENRERENQHSRSPGQQIPSQQQGHRFPSPPPPSPFVKPVLSYGAANPFLANLPPAQGVYGAPVESSHRGDAIRAFFELNPQLTGYDGSSGAAPAPPTGASSDDTWEALEASLDANTRRRHRIF
uniref:CG16772 protein n=1 Tax=Caenorhabditis tropicalis TaxID=1561998 RepID=A0A1I7TBW8_9PELO